MRPFDNAQGRPFDNAQDAPQSGPYSGHPLDRQAFPFEGDPNEDQYFNLGRETFLAPVIWEHGWPIVSPGYGRVKFEHPVPNLPEQCWPTRPSCDNFEGDKLDYVWNFLRTPREAFYSLTERPGYLRLKLRPQKLSEWVCPSFVGRRQQDINFAARAAMEFAPQASNEEAGLVLLQNSGFHFRFVRTQDKISLIKCESGEETVLAELSISADRVYFKIEAYGEAYSFCVAEKAEAWQAVAENVDGRILSTTVAKGFVGTYIGLYASSNGESSNVVADFDWFEYTQIERS
jgi:alpha-N-arabinofuranosidase